MEKLKHTVNILVILTLSFYSAAFLVTDIHCGHRVGAICADGWRSSATGRGACSHHGGVTRWLYSDGDGPVAFLEQPLYQLGHLSLSGVGISSLILYFRQRNLKR